MRGNERRVVFQTSRSSKKVPNLQLKVAEIKLFLTDVILYGVAKVDDSDFGDILTYEK